MDLKRASKTGLLALIALFVTAFPSPAFADGINLIVNGSFENPVVPADSQCGPFKDCLGYHNGVAGNDNIGGWLLFGKDGMKDVGGELQPIPFAPATILLLGNPYTETTIAGPTLFFQPQSGLQSIDLTGEGNQGLDHGVKQVVDTTAGLSYLLTFWFGHQYSQADGYKGGDAALMLFINGSSVGSFGNSIDTVNNVSWSQFSYQFTATGEPTVIAFGSNTPVGNNFAGLDNVSLVAVPEASSLVLLGIGTILLASLLHRQTSRRRGVH